MSCFHFRKHLLKAGTFKVGTGITIIYKENRVRKMVFFRILQKDSFLVFYG